MKCLNLNPSYFTITTYLILQVSLRIGEVTSGRGNPQTVMTGNGKFFDDFMLTAVPVGFSIYFVKHIMVCQITKEKHKPFIKNPIMNEGDSNFLNIYCKMVMAFLLSTHTQVEFR